MMITVFYRQNPITHMRKSHPLILASLLIILGACKKDNTSTSNPFSTVTEIINYPASVPSTAAGSLYATSGWVYSYYANALDSAKTGSATAWFGNVYNPVYAGLVIVNGDTLVDSVSYPWGGYNPNKFSPVFSSNAVTWSVSGNSTDSIPAFNYTENTLSCYNRFKHSGCHQRRQRHYAALQNFRHLRLFVLLARWWRTTRKKRYHFYQR
jgi:hypothetical protein